MASWYDALKAAFVRASPDKDVGQLPDHFHHALSDALGGLDVDVVHAAEFRGKEGFVLVQAERAWFARFEAPNTTELLFLGDMRGGLYSEVHVPDGNGGVEIDGLRTPAF
jgi:hypothetical protein